MKHLIMALLSTCLFYPVASYGQEASAEESLPAFAAKVVREDTKNYSLVSADQKIRFTNPWVMKVAKGQGTFFSVVIQNQDTQPIILEKITTPVSEVRLLQTLALDTGRGNSKYNFEVPYSEIISIAAGGSLTISVQGLRAKLVKLQQDLPEGSFIPVTLHFKGRDPVAFNVRAHK